MYAACVPPAIAALESLAAILHKAAAWTEARKIDPAILLGSRLAPDMFALTRQVQIACDSAKSGCALLAGVEAPRMEDEETTIPELADRIARTIAFLQSVPAAAFEGADTRIINRKLRGEQMAFKGHDYLTRFVLPNLYFHAAAAYMILRHNGLDIGKRDFLGPLPAV